MGIKIGGQSGRKSGTENTDECLPLSSDQLCHHGNKSQTSALGLWCLSNHQPAVVDLAIQGVQVNHSLCFPSPSCFIHLSVWHTAWPQYILMGEWGKNLCTNKRSSNRFTKLIGITRTHFITGISLRHWTNWLHILKQKQSQPQGAWHFSQGSWGGVPAHSRAGLHGT